jgi:hypothetical protein
MVGFLCGGVEMELWDDSLAVWVSRMGQFENYFDLIHIYYYTFTHAKRTN